MATDTYQVKEVARLSGVTVRALHHYDAIGLLCPSTRTEAGYRLYTAADLLLLQQILVYRELGLPLEKIKAIVGDPAFDRPAALREQRQDLQRRADHTQSMIRAIDLALRAHEGEETMTAEKLFDGFDPAKYEAEAKQRWGDTHAYAESKRRHGGYSKEDVARMKAEGDELLGRIAAAMGAGSTPSSSAAMNLAEEHRLQIDRWHYPCNHVMHAALGQMYVTDSRFTESLDKHGAGVAVFLAAAIEANGKRVD